MRRKTRGPKKRATGDNWPVSPKYPNSFVRLAHFGREIRNNSGRASAACSTICRGTEPSPRIITRDAALPLGGRGRSKTEWWGSAGYIRKVPTPKGRSRLEISAVKDLRPWLVALYPRVSLLNSILFLYR